MRSGEQGCDSDPSKLDWSRAALESAGFVGWHPFSELRERLRSIDRTDAGIYVVYRTTSDFPQWLRRNPGGTWRGDPTVTRPELVANWVHGANVLYIGKAKGGQLRNRLRAYCSFGEGGKGRHYGGRLIWQLEQAWDLLIAWRVTGLDEDPLAAEGEMIRRFKGSFGKRPFANNPDLLGE